jgi:hypothetical protein
MQHLLPRAASVTAIGIIWFVWMCACHPSEMQIGLLVITFELTDRFLQNVV